ncbi:related to HAD superfamily hydrolase [Rhynchosporium secalis]|uniref:Related to HAD superfamily hydrolase n=1 Tax=Rhynchosporium secalis TaxID=38038 RepID=A0A1E1LWK1_RHYSE|nr:related to HAD superfamily hydrolase [Rhynchosporium secalis]
MPQNWMFGQMRSALEIPKNVDILDHIHSLPSSEQDAAQEKIRAIERSAMSSQEAQPGLVSLMEYLETKKIPKGICTRNFDAPVTHLLEKFLEGKEFGPIVTRETRAVLFHRLLWCATERLDGRLLSTDVLIQLEFKPPKPNPAGILHIAKTWGFLNNEGAGDASQLIMVGDSIDDMTAGHTAGAATVLLVNDVNAHLAEHEHTDLIVSRLDDLIEVLEKGFVGRIGSEEENNTRERAEHVLRGGRSEDGVRS